jgi:hypothetical protein
MILIIKLTPHRTLICITYTRKNAQVVTNLQAAADL